MDTNATLSYGYMYPYDNGGTYDSEVPEMLLYAQIMRIRKSLRDKVAQKYGIKFNEYFGEDGPTVIYSVAWEEGTIKDGDLSDEKRLAYQQNLEKFLQELGIDVNAHENLSPPTWHLLTTLD